MSAFVDEAQLNVRGGDGGAGCVSFRREGPVAFGGPNGGDGGDGGSVWLEADHNVASLLAFRDHPHRRAGDGVHGMGKDLHGRRGQEMLIKVPEGTVVRDMYTNEILADLPEHGARFCVALVQPSQGAKVCRTRRTWKRALAEAGTQTDGRCCTCRFS